MTLPEQSNRTPDEVITRPVSSSFNAAFENPALPTAVNEQQIIGRGRKKSNGKCSLKRLLSTAVVMLLPDRNYHCNWNGQTHSDGTHIQQVCLYPVPFDSKILERKPF
jgi:hypothetical protein